jgi:hypothetical protein
MGDECHRQGGELGDLLEVDHPHATEHPQSVQQQDSPPLMALTALIESDI